MTVYIGQIGRMVRLYSTPSAQVVYEDRATFKTTLEGARKAQVRPASGRRTWSLNASFADPSEQSAIMAFINGEWGNGPFVYVSADAPVINLLTPAAASCEPAEFTPTTGLVLTPGGPMLTADGWAGRSFAKNTVNAVFFGLDMLPAIPGRSVTASAYVRGLGGVVRLNWYDIAGQSISTASSAVAAGASGVVRSHVTGSPPAGAVGFRVSASKEVTQACRPAATWSDGLLEWGAGQGCTKAVIHGASSDLIMASRDTRGSRYSNLGFTVTEVG